jgi:4-diphosphocytidyl-2-C-methyl-D-erythritol kinase
VFYPVPLNDALEIVQSSDNDNHFTTSGLQIDGVKESNICLKAYYLLKKDFPELPAIKMHLHKVIPTGAGLGGGSADGAYTLMLLNKKFNLDISEEKLIVYALELGSDCPFFIRNKPSYATGRGEQLKDVELDLKAYKIVLVNPGIHVNTGWAFSKITPSKNRTSIHEIIHQPVATWKDVLKNDFEQAVFTEYPEIKSIKETLYSKGAIYASMTGSGSTVYGIFDKDREYVFDFPSHYFMNVPISFNP